MPVNRNHKPSSYEDWSPWGYRIGHFQPVAIDQQRLLVSTWEKRCYVLDLKHRTCTAEPLIGPPKNRYAGRCLRSPTVSTIGTVQICAVATTAGWAGVWRLGATEATVLFPVSGGSVNATAMAQDGGRLAVGLGYYPLDSVSTAEAVVELPLPGSGSGDRTPPERFWLRSFFATSAALVRNSTTASRTVIAQVLSRTLSGFGTLTATPKIISEGVGVEGRWVRNRGWCRGKGGSAQTCMCACVA